MGESKEDLETRYSDRLERLSEELTANIPSEDEATNDNNELNEFLESDEWDDKLAQFVVLNEATPEGLADFAAQGETFAALAEQLLEDTDLLKRMLVADGATGGKYGQAMKLYTDILKESTEANDADSVLQRLALAIALVHAVPMEQNNPKESDYAKFVDPLKRYRSYKKAYEGGELDPAFDSLTAWELRFVVDGDEPDETSDWGRKMLRNFRPDQVLAKNYDWRYSGLVRTDVPYGSGRVRYDRPELQQYQNILMNGGICGRRAFIGRFALRAFGIPTTRRPSPGHGALCHWTPQKWVVNLGGGFGCGSTPATKYKKDSDFYACTQARNDRTAYMKVKRAQWVGDLVGEKAVYGEHDPNKKELGYWYGVSLETQKAIIDKKVVPPPLVGHKETIAERILASSPGDNEITSENGVITIPAAGIPKKTRDVSVMPSFLGGSQIYLPAFHPQGKTMMRGGSWKSDSDFCCSGKRLLSDGYGKYHDWGFRAALSPPESGDNDEDGGEGGDGTCEETLTLDLGGGVTMELVYIPPGTFVMGGENTKEGRFLTVDVPKHEVQLSHGFYLGKYPVTQEQYKAVLDKNPSKSTKKPKCPVDNIGEPDCAEFCDKLSEKTGQDVRLPTDAEWEYACRGGGKGDTKWFFGDDPSELGEYAWFKKNSGNKSHPVGEKKPNPFGLYDVYGQVHERVSDKYAKNYYATSPRVDPMGPSQGTKSNLEYKVTVPSPGEYSLTARVVTANYNQRLNVAANGQKEAAVLEMPFTCGDWQDSEPVVLRLKEGENTLKLWRDMPPQYGVVVKDFTLKAAN